MNGEPLERISAGLAHTCAVSQEGSSYCWGNAESGRLGNDEIVGEHATPVAVLEPGGAEPANDWAQVSAGHEHSCGLKKDGRIFCWGLAENGRLGNGETEGTFATPVAVLEPGGQAAARNWSSIAAGGTHTCAMKKDGRAFCWGGNDKGQLGNNDKGQDSATPVAVLDPGAAPAKSDWLSVSVGHGHVCGVKKDGRALCWGWGGANQLGTGSNANVATPGLVPEIGGEAPVADWAHVSAGPEHSCGRKTDGRLLCWGTNSSGQLGNLPQSAGATPLPVLEPDGSAPAGGWLQVTTGYVNSCGLKPGGRLYCWGNGGYGSNGNNEYPSYARPQAVLEPGGGAPVADWAVVSGGFFFNCALKTNGKAICWGKGDNGQLGNGADELIVRIPVEVLVPAAQ